MADFNPTPDETEIREVAREVVESMTPEERGAFAVRLYLQALADASRHARPAPRRLGPGDHGQA